MGSSTSVASEPVLADPIIERTVLPQFASLNELHDFLQAQAPTLTMGITGMSEVTYGSRDNSDLPSLSVHRCGTPRAFLETKPQIINDFHDLPEFDINQPLEDQITLAELFKNDRPLYDVIIQLSAVARLYIEYVKTFATPSNVEFLGLCNCEELIGDRKISDENSKHVILLMKAILLSYVKNGFQNPELINIEMLRQCFQEIPVDTVVEPKSRVTPVQFFGFLIRKRLNTIVGFNQTCPSIPDPVTLE